MSNHLEHRLRNEAQAIVTTPASALPERIRAAVAIDRATTIGHPAPIRFPQRYRVPWLATAAAVAAVVAITWIAVPTPKPQPAATVTWSDLDQVRRQMGALIPQIPPPRPASMSKIISVDLRAIDPAVLAQREVAAIGADLRTVAAVIRQAVPF